jgi:hypothetical protein
MWTSIFQHLCEKRRINLRLTFISACFALIWLLSQPSPAYSAQISLAWNKPNDIRVVGYKVYAGKSGTDYKASPYRTINSADQTSCVISDLEGGQRYCFAAQSFDANGLGSDYSEILNYLVPSENDIDNDGDGYTENQGDCNDSNAAIRPGATEVCGDGIDNNCNGSVDEGCTRTWYRDTDGDRYSNGSSLQSVNRPASNYYLASELTATTGDCNDSNAAIHPGATEICGDGIDQDCNGVDLPCLTDPLEVDNDGDGFTENAGDCNDSNASIHPGATEICGDGIDQDCNSGDLNCDPDVEFVMENGEVQVGRNWLFVPLKKYFADPVVIAEPMSLKDSSPAVIRVRYVNSMGFQIRVQEWDYLDGIHTTETVGYIVLEAGHQILPDGAHVEAGTFDEDQYKKVSFMKPFNKVPVVMASVVSYNDSDAVADRVSSVSTGSFSLTLQEQRANTDGHSTETVSYIAWEPSKGIIDGMAYEVNKTSKIVTNKNYTIIFKQKFTSSPVFVADMQTMNDSDTANIRWPNKYANKVLININEEKSKTSVISHKAEVVGYILVK